MTIKTIGCTRQYVERCDKFSFALKMKEKEIQGDIKKKVVCLGTLQWHSVELGDRFKIVESSRKSDGTARCSINS